MVPLVCLKLVLCSLLFFGLSQPCISSWFFKSTLLTPSIGVRGFSVSKILKPRASTEKARNAENCSLQACLFSPRASRSISLKVVLIVVVVLVVVVTNYKLSHIKFLQYKDGTIEPVTYPILLVRNTKSGLERAVQNVSHSVSACFPQGSMDSDAYTETTWSMKLIPETVQKLTRQEIIALCAQLMLKSTDEVVAFDA